MKIMNTLAAKFPVEEALNFLEEKDTRVRSKNLKEICEIYDIAISCLPLFAHIPLVRGESGKYSVTDTLVALQKQDTLVTEQGETIDAMHIILLFKFLGLANAGEIAGKKPMTTNVAKSGNIPKFLYAFKLLKGIQYEEWDKEDSRMPLALGKQLSAILEVSEIITPKIYEIYFKDNIQALRDEGLTNSKGVQGLLTSYTIYNPIISKIISMVQMQIEGKDTLHNEESIFTLAKMNKNSVTSILKIILQTYVCNVALRKPDAMILDIWDWDSTPEPFDEEVQVQKAGYNPTSAPAYDDGLPF